MTAPSPRPPDPDRGIRAPAMLLGMGMALLLAAGLPYGEFLLKGTRMGLSSATPGALFLLFLLVLAVQPLLGSVRRHWMLTRPELIAVAVMMMVACALATRGFTGAFVGILSAPYYYATPDNGWAESLWPHLPAWAVPRDRQAMTWFYEGLPAGQPLPWGAWAESLGWWLLFMAAFCTVVVCAVVILRRQWMDHEHLVYPVAQVPLALIDDGGRPGDRLKPFLRNPVMWLGFALVFGLHSFNLLSQFRDGVSGISLVSASLPLVRGGATLSIHLNYLMLGLAYFIHTGVAFSLWFFYLLITWESGLLTMAGVHTTTTFGVFSAGGPVRGLISCQIMGAMVVLVLWGLWTARTHLRGVWRQAWRGGQDDPGELLSCRAAVIGLAAGLVVMSAWLWRAGLPGWAVPVLLFGAFTVFLALTRVIVEAGLTSALQGLTGGGFLVTVAGNQALGTAGQLAVGLTAPWAGDHLVFLMAPAANGARMLHEVRRWRRRLLLLLAAALLIGGGGSVLTTIALAYDHGAVNLHQQYFASFARAPWSVAMDWLEEPSGPHWFEAGWIGGGGAAMALLTLARQRLLWWPLHPIGFMTGGMWMLHSTWFSIFLAWLIKSLVLRYAGPAGYRVTRWFFVGLILGHVTAGGFWLVVEAGTGIGLGRIPMY